MSVFFDILLIGIILFFVIRYAIKGLIQAVLSFGKFIFSVIIAIAIGKPVAAWISDGFMRKWLANGVYGKISEHIVDGRSLSEFFNNIPESFVNLVKLFGGDLSLLQQKYGSAESSEAVLRDMASTITAPVADTASAIIAYVVIFLIALIVLSILAALLKKVKVPILTRIDKILGLTLGLILGILSASMLATVIYTVLELVSAVNGNADIMNIYHDSIIFEFIHKINIFSFIRDLL